MKKLMEMAASVTVVVLIAAPVVAGVYVGMMTDKSHHGVAQAAEGHGEAGHGAAEPAAGGTAGGHPPSISNHDHDDHAPGSTPDNPKAPEFQAGDGMKPHLCGSQELVGQKLEVAEEKLRAAHKIYRKLKPGAPMTMDYSADRYNLDVDDHGVVTRVWCG